MYNTVYDRFNTFNCNLGAVNGNLGAVNGYLVAMIKKYKFFRLQIRFFVSS